MGPLKPSFFVTESIILGENIGTDIVFKVSFKININHNIN